MTKMVRLYSGFRRPDRTSIVMPAKAGIQRSDDGNSS